MADSDGNPGFDFPPEYAQRISKIIAYWAVVEYDINLSIWHLAGVYPAIGACITEQIYTLDGRCKALLALLKLRKAPKAIVDRVNKFSEKSHRARDIRNRIAHDTWHESMGGKIQQLELGARGVLTYGFKNIEPDRLKTDAEIVRKAMVEAVAIRDDVEAALPTLPKIPLGELHPIVHSSGGSVQTRSIDRTFVLFPPRPSLR
jgi:hypothetical protein